MTWIPGRRGWMKEYKHKKYAVSCRQLGTPETKEGSYQAANDWWAAKRAEVDGYAPRPVLPGSPEAVQLLLEAWAGGPVRTIEEVAGVLLDLAANRNDVNNKQALLEGVLGPERLAQLEAHIKAVGATPAPLPGRSIAAHAEAWHQAQQAQVAAGQLSPDRYSANRNALAHFQSFAGAHADVDTIDAIRLQGFYLYCLSQVAARRKDPTTGWSLSFAKDVFSVAKTFVRWLWENGTIDLPKNIGSKAFKFGTGHKAIITWRPDEYKKAVSEAPGKLKLGLLLMANCGMTQADVSDLLDSEVDWAAGRVIRKRSKTAAHDHTPTVNYKLWPSTFRLLQQYRSGTERVLLTESGKPFVRKELASGRMRKADGFASNYVHLKKRLKLKRSLKQLRKLGATLLESHPTYGRFVPYFLGHSPRSVSSRHYAAPSQALFDEAVTWLGQQLGQA
jgi:integrase